MDNLVEFNTSLNSALFHMAHTTVWAGGIFGLIGSMSYQMGDSNPIEGAIVSGIWGGLLSMVPIGLGISMGINNYLEENNYLTKYKNKMRKIENHTQEVK